MMHGAYNVKKLQIILFLSDITYIAANNIENDGQQGAHKTEHDEYFIYTKKGILYKECSELSIIRKCPQKYSVEWQFTEI